MAPRDDRIINIRQSVRQNSVRQNSCRPVEFSRQRACSASTSDNSQTQSPTSSAGSTSSASDLSLHDNHHAYNTMASFYKPRPLAQAPRNGTEDIKRILGSNYKRIVDKSSTAVNKSANIFRRKVLRINQSTTEIQDRYIAPPSSIFQQSLRSHNDSLESTLPCPSDESSLRRRPSGASLYELAAPCAEELHVAKNLRYATSELCLVRSELSGDTPEVPSLPQTSVHELAASKPLPSTPQSCLSVAPTVVSESRPVTATSNYSMKPKLSPLSTSAVPLPSTGRHIPPELNPFAPVATVVTTCYAAPPTPVIGASTARSSRAEEHNGGETRSTSPERRPPTPPHLERTVRRPAPLRPSNLKLFPSTQPSQLSLPKSVAIKRLSIVPVESKGSLRPVYRTVPSGTASALRSRSTSNLTASTLHLQTPSTEQGPGSDCSRPQSRAASTAFSSKQSKAEAQAALDELAKAKEKVQREWTLMAFSVPYGDAEKCPAPFRTSKAADLRSGKRWKGNHVRHIPRPA